MFLAQTMDESIRILYVDDDPELRYLMGLILRKEGFRTVFAESGAQALDLWQKDPVDLIILDVMMPEMNGYETCRRIRTRSDIPIIFLSVLDDEDEIVKGFEAGGYDYVSKPFHLKELIARINAVLRYKRPPKVLPQGIPLRQALSNPAM
jgi:two-component system OmpR family response regulator